MSVVKIKIYMMCCISLLYFYFILSMLYFHVIFFMLYFPITFCVVFSCYIFVFYFPRVEFLCHILHVESVVWRGPDVSVRESDILGHCYSLAGQLITRKST